MLSRLGTSPISKDLAAPPVGSLPCRVLLDTGSLACDFISGDLLARLQGQDYVYQPLYTEPFKLGNAGSHYNPSNSATPVLIITSGVTTIPSAAILILPLLKKAMQPPLAYSLSFWQDSFSRQSPAGNILPKKQNSKIPKFQNSRQKMKSGPELQFRFLISWQDFNRRARRHNSKILPGFPEKILPKR